MVRVTPPVSIELDRGGRYALSPRRRGSNRVTLGRGASGSFAVHSKMRLG